MSALTPPTDMPTPTTDKITQAAMETIYLCKFRVSMDGEWLCLRELDDISLTPDPEPAHEGTVRPGLPAPRPGPAGSPLSAPRRAARGRPSRPPPSSLRRCREQMPPCPRGSLSEDAGAC